MDQTTGAGQLVADPEFCIKFRYAMSLQESLEEPNSSLSENERMFQESRLDQFTANSRSMRLLSAVDLGALLKELSGSELETLSRFLLMSQTTPQSEEELVNRPLDDLK